MNRVSLVAGRFYTLYAYEKDIRRLIPALDYLYFLKLILSLKLEFAEHLQLWLKNFSSKKV